MRYKTPRHALLFLSLCLGGGALSSQPAASPAEPAIAFRGDLQLTETDRLVLSRFIGHAVDFARGLTPAGVAGKCRESPEMFAWIDFRQLNCLNIACELTGDTAYLDLLRDSLEIYRGLLSTGTDPFLGWYGSPIKPRIPADNPGVQIDEIQMTFRCIAVAGRWIELARANTAYAEANAGTIAAWLDLMETHLFPKWDQRGFFVEIPGRGGVYRGLDFPINAGQPTLSHEKLSIIVDGCLQLHRVTGKDIHLRRALQLGAWFKSCLSLVDGQYEWMSWCPAGRWDISPTKDDSWIPGWMGPDPNGPWYVAALSIALNLYQHGLLFDDRDLGRFIRTQKTRCWNGDFEHPQYRTVAGTANEWTKGRFLSLQLAHYDAGLTRLAFFGPHEAEVLEHSANPWRGGINAQDYVLEKYLRRPLVAGDPQPWRQTGERFLAGDENRALYERLAFEVGAPGAVIADRPSRMFTTGAD